MKNGANKWCSETMSVVGGSKKSVKSVCVGGQSVRSVTGGGNNHTMRSSVRGKRDMGERERERERRDGGRDRSRERRRRDPNREEKDEEHRCDRGGF